MKISYQNKNIGNKIFSFFIRLEHAARKVKALIDSL